MSLHTPVGVAAVFQDLGQALGLPQLKPDAQGLCQLVFDGRWLVTFAHLAAMGRMVLSCPIGPAHAIGPDTQTAMLRAGFMGQGCGGGQLVIAPDGRPHVQMHLGQGETTPAMVTAALENLLTQAETWSERLSRSESSGPRGGVTAGPASAVRPHDWAMQRV